MLVLSNIYHLVTPDFNRGAAGQLLPHLSSLQNIHIWDVMRMFCKDDRCGSWV